VHPEGQLGRRYRDLLGRVNQIVAAAADTTLLVVAGRVVRLEDPWQVLG
jgi:adenosyl cobinamide kinase/adenosyl cobinamide phosphate guanylyltransferase